MSATSHHFLWGAGLGAAAVTSTQILTWTGLGLTFWTWTSTFLLVLVFSVLAARSLRARLGFPPSVPQTAWMVWVMVLVSCVMYQTYMFVYIHVIEPTWVDTVAEFWGGQLREGGKSEEEIRQTLSDFRNQWRTSYVFSVGIVRYSVAPYILGLVAATVAVVRPGTRRRALEPR